MDPKKFQSILDHFGVGKFHLIINSEILKIYNFHIKIFFLETSIGDYALIELPKEIFNRSELQEEVDQKFKFYNQIFTYPKDKKLQFAHVDGYYYSLRKL